MFDIDDIAYIHRAGLDSWEVAIRLNDGLVREPGFLVCLFGGINERYKYIVIKTSDYVRLNNALKSLGRIVGD